MAILAGVILTGLMLLTVVDVVLRQWNGSGVHGGIEVSETVLAAAVFLGMAPAEVDRVHVRSPLLVERLPQAWADGLRLLGWLMTTLFIGWLTLKNWSLALASYDIREFRVGVSNVPVWPAKLAVLAGLVAFLVVVIASLLVLLRSSVRRVR